MKSVTGIINDLLLSWKNNMKLDKFFQLLKICWTAQKFGSHV